MKLLIEIDSPGIEDLHVREPDVPAEVGAFVARLVRSRTRGPEPRVSVQVVGKDQVVANVEQLLKLQSKATALRWIVECDDREISAAVENAKKLVKGD